MKKYLLSLITPLIMTPALTPIITHAEPNLTYNDFDCGNYRPEGFVKAGLRPGIKLLQSGDTLGGYQCDYGYNDKDGQTLTISFFKPDPDQDFKQINESSRDFLNSILLSVSHGNSSIDHERVKSVQIHGHPAEIYDYQSNHYTIGKVICVSLKPRSTGVVTITNFSEQTLSDDALVNLARATIK